jgi:hypothetical protein
MHIERNLQESNQLVDVVALVLIIPTIDLEIDLQISH